MSVDRVVEAAARIADDRGFEAVTLAAVAECLGVRAPSLYSHIDGLADLQHRLATLAMTELGERIRDAMLGLAGREALVALASVTRAYVAEHPGRYASTIGVRLAGPHDPLLQASSRVIDAIAAVLRGYRIPEGQMVHAIRTVRCALHGYAALEATDAFQWSDDAAQTLEWMIDLIDRGLPR